MQSTMLQVDSAESSAQERHTNEVHTRVVQSTVLRLARAASCYQKDTENNSPFSHGAKTVYGCRTNYYEVKLVMRNIGNI